MKRDTIFRIASITKPITAVAAMILVEECKLRLDESIEPWLPELANRRVLKSISSQLDDTVPALRAITLRDVLTYRMGFGSVMAMPDTYPIQKSIREYRIGGDGPMLPTLAPATEEWLQKLGSLPWMAQPGERWMYQVSGDVLGVLVARVSGQSLGTFMRQRIFDPLGMKDTAFHVPSEKIARLPGFYFFNHQTNTLDVFDDAANSAWLSEPPFESGVHLVLDRFLRRPIAIDRDAQLLGERQQALRLYDQAVRWMRKNKPNDEELCRFRAEAAELLGVGDPIRSKMVSRRRQ